MNEFPVFRTVVVAVVDTAMPAHAVFRRIFVVIVIKRIAPAGNGFVAFEQFFERFALHFLGNGDAAQVEKRRRKVDILRQLIDFVALHDSGPCHHHRHTERFFIHETFVEPAVFAEIKSLVGGVANDGIFVQAALFQIIEELAHAVVHAANRCEVILHVALIRPALEPAELIAICGEPCFVVAVISPFVPFCLRANSGVEKRVIFFDIGVDVFCDLFVGHPRREHPPRERVLVARREQLQVRRPAHRPKYRHVLRLCGGAPLVVIEEIGRFRERNLVEEIVVFFFGNPVSMRRLVMHHKEKRFCLIALVFEPIDGAVGNDFRGITLGDDLSGGALEPSVDVPANHVGIDVFALPDENLPPVEPGRIARQMEFADDAGLVTVGVKNFCDIVLPVVKRAPFVAHVAVRVRMLARENARAGRSGNGVRAVVAHEQRAVVRNAVDVRRRRELRNRMPVSGNRLHGVVVAHDVNDVERFSVRGNALRAPRGYAERGQRTHGAKGRKTGNAFHAKRLCSRRPALSNAFPFPPTAEKTKSLRREERRKLVGGRP